MFDNTRLSNIAESLALALMLAREWNVGLIHSSGYSKMASINLEHRIHLNSAIELPHYLADFGVIITINHVGKTVHDVAPVDQAEIFSHPNHPVWVIMGKLTDQSLGVLSIVTNSGWV